MRANYILATNRSWNVEAFYKYRVTMIGRWVIVTCPDDLVSVVQMLQPRYVFFPHWSYMVPAAVFDAVECVAFHMTDLPRGRGGSPLQNLIVRGQKATTLSAFRMSAELDAGPVYAKRPLELDGSAQEIFERAAGIAMEMIDQITRAQPQPQPQPQRGESTRFARRTPAQSVVPEYADKETLYDHIRMLDAEDYPHAFIDHGRWRVRFTGARLNGSVVRPQAEFERIDRERAGG